MPIEIFTYTITFMTLLFTLPSDDESRPAYPMPYFRTSAPHIRSPPRDDQSPSVAISLLPILYLGLTLMAVLVHLSSWERLYTLYRIQGSSLSTSLVHKRPDKWSVSDILCNGLESSLRFSTIILGGPTTTHGALGKLVRRNRHTATNLSGGDSFFLSFTSRDVPVISLAFGKYYIV